MATIVTKNETYQSGSGNLKLTVSIPFGQFGSFSVQKDGDLIISFAQAITDYDLGPISGLSGKKLIIEAIVRDVQANTNQTGLDIQLQDGSNNQSFNYTQAAASNNGSVFYDITITL